MAVFTMHYAVVVHQQLLYDSEVRDESQRVLEIPEPIYFARSPSIEFVQDISPLLYHFPIWRSVAT